MQGFQKFVFLAFILSDWNRYSCVSGATNKVFKVGENETAGLPCDHGLNADEVLINAIQWVVGEDKSPVAKVDRRGKLSVEKSDMVGRVNISYPEGVLRITNLRRRDSNVYKCVLVVNGGRREIPDLKQLDVLVPPEKFAIKCSASHIGNPGEDCSAIKSDKIMSLKCSAQSSPVSRILWIQPNNCSVNTTQVEEKQLPDGLIQSGTVLRNLCEGEYCCHAIFDEYGMFRRETKCLSIVRSAGTDKPRGSGTSPLTSQTKWQLYAIIGAVVLFLVLLIIFIGCCLCCYKRKHGHCPDVCSLPLHQPHDRKVPVTVDINGDGEPETMALTPFLGPNNVGPNQRVFNFVVDQANDDPNVDRVKVTQDIEPGGEKSRMVEIYKKKDALLQPDFNVPPGLFRRALSNSDVSKIIYKESVDENGRTKRELDIIKSDEMENEVASRSDVRAAGSTGSYQRQLSIHPSSSDSDVRKVRFQRQETVVEGDDVDGYVYLPRASEVNRRQMKYQQSLSVDIDDVD